VVVVVDVVVVGPPVVVVGAAVVVVGPPVVVVVVDVVVVGAAVVVVGAAVVVVGAAVVVVDVGSGAHSTVTRRPVATDLAQAAPISLEPRPSVKRAFGAVMKARTSLPALMWTSSPVTLSNGVGVAASGSNVVSFPNHAFPPTLMVDWLPPVTLRRTCRPVLMLQKV